MCQPEKFESRLLGPTIQLSISNQPSAFRKSELPTHEAPQLNAAAQRMHLKRLRGELRSKLGTQIRPSRPLSPAVQKRAKTSILCF
jgi:hypothetical protein